MMAKEQQRQERAVTHCRVPGKRLQAKEGGPMGGSSLAHTRCDRSHVITRSTGGYMTYIHDCTSGVNVKIVINWFNRRIYSFVS